MMIGFNGIVVAVPQRAFSGQLHKKIQRIPKFDIFVCRKKTHDFAGSSSTRGAKSGT